MAAAARQPLHDLIDQLQRELVNFEAFVITGHRERVRERFERYEHSTQAADSATAPASATDPACSSGLCVLLLSLPLPQLQRLARILPLLLLTLPPQQNRWLVDHRESGSRELIGDVAAAARQLLHDLIDQLQRELVNFEAFVITGIGNGLPLVRAPGNVRAIDLLAKREAGDAAAWLARTVSPSVPEALD